MLDVTVAPLLTDGGAAHGASIVFEDVSRYATMRRELEGNRRELELAYEELQSTIDELETTNEELQSANEELQTTNEELQSTNEELETMNEELQSTNEELETINDELRDRTSDLNRVNDFLEAILTSLGIGVAVVDRQQRVQVWNQRAEDLWGVRQDEAVEHHLLALDIGLPVERLAGPLRSVLSGSSEREQAMLEAVNRRGRAIECATTILPLLSDGDGSAGARGDRADGAHADRLTGPQARQEPATPRVARQRARSSDVCSASRAVVPNSVPSSSSCCSHCSRTRWKAAVISAARGGAGSPRRSARRVTVAAGRSGAARSGGSGGSSRRRIGITRSIPGAGMPIGAPVRSHVPSSRRLTSPCRTSSPSAVETVGRRAPTSWPSIRCESVMGRATPSGGDAAPALGEMPEEGEQPPVDAVELGDRLRDREPQGALVDPVEDRGADLGIASELGADAAVEQREPAAGEHVPADRVLQQRRSPRGSARVARRRPGRAAPC